MIVIAILVGVVGAGTAFLFETTVNAIRSSLSSVVSDQSVNILYLIMPAVGIILVTLFVKYVVRDNISHGVTKILSAITHKGSQLKSHNMYSSVLAGATTIGFGGSVGPEAPLVMTGAAVGSNIGRFFRMNYRDTTILLGCGVAAALAGIFKAPVTGVVFVLEVLMLNITMLSVIPVLIAAAVSTSLVYLFHGFSPIFFVDSEKMVVDVSQLPYYIILALMCGFAAYYLIYSSSRIEALFRKIKRQWVKWLIGGSVLGVLIFIFPPLYGQGYNSISTLINDDVQNIFNNTLFYSFSGNEWVLLAFLVAVILLKSIAMATTNAAGGVGGAFAPSLFLGAFVGFFCAKMFNTVFGLELPVVPFTLVGMAGVMSGAMNSPLTAIFLIAEITGGYRLFMPLMLVSAVSFGLSYYLSPYSVYTRELFLKGDKISLGGERSILFIQLERLVEDDFVTVREDMTLGDLVEVVAESRRNIFPVVDERRHLVGVVTLDDIRADMFEQELYDKVLIQDYMTPPPEIINLGDDMSIVLSKFDKSGAWNLPVVSGEDRYIGFVSKSKIFSEYRSELSK